MARLRQLNPNNYTGAGQISAEFESLIRYLNAAELGNKTVAELLAQIFDEDGEWQGPVELRLDSTNGLQYRVGEYPNPEDGWITIAAVSALKGPPGTNVGEIEGPFFFNRQDFTATAAQTTFNYTYDATVADLLVYKNGVLQKPNPSGDYTANGTTIVFGVGLNLNDRVTVYSIRANAVADYRRQDYVASASQAVFPFVHTADESLLVFRNGILQRSGGANDYTSDAGSDTVTFTSALAAAETVTILTVENQAIQNVAGLMLSGAYCNADNLILWSKIAVANDEIAQAKVSGLAAGLAAKAKITISATAPVGPVDGNFWLDTSVNPALLKFYANAQWNLTSPASSVPTYGTTNAGQYLRVNGTGTALEFGAIDFSALVPKTYMGAANGVATLDSTGRIPNAQMPTTFSAETIPLAVSGAVANGTYLCKRLFRQKVRLDGLTCKLSAGTCTIQISVDGVTVGSTQAVSTTVADVVFGTAIEIDARTASKRLEIVVTGQVGANNLEVGLAAATTA